MKGMIILYIFFVMLCGCSHSDDDNGPILPGDGEDRIFNETTTGPNASLRSIEIVEVQGWYESPAINRSSGGNCTSYPSDRMNSGRKMWKVYKPLWQYAATASVKFNSGFYVPTVYLAKANRILSGKGRGFVLRPGETTKNIVAGWGPYGDTSNVMTICLK